MCTQACLSTDIHALIFNSDRYQLPIQMDIDGELNQFLASRPRVICLERGDTWLKLSVDMVAAWEGPM